MSPALQAPCSVCLRTIQLRGDQPIRHGFSAIGVRHGSNSGYHTGPCHGSTFPHLGISTEGTVWALDKAKERLKAVEAEIVVLEGHPDLIWYPRLAGSYNRVSGGLPDMARAVTLRYGAEEGYAGDGRPTYANEHKRRVAAQVAIAQELKRAIEAYTKVLATWKPQAAEPVPGKVETCHLAQERQHKRFGKWQGIACRFTRPGAASEAVKTTDPSKVTCKKCRAQLGLPST